MIILMFVYLYFTMAQLPITARNVHRRPAGGSGSAALQRAAPPHGPSPLLGSGPRRIRASRYGKLRLDFFIAKL